MNDIRGELERILDYWTLKYNNSKKQIAQLPEGRLHREMRAGAPYYFQATGGKETLRRRGIMKDQQLIRQLAQKKYLEISGEKLAQNMKVLRDAIGRMEDCSPEAVLRELPAAYRAIPGECFFQSPGRPGPAKAGRPAGRPEGAESPANTESPATSGAIDIPGAMEEARNEPDPQKRIKRIREIQRIWAEEPFEQNGKNPEGRTQVTSRNLKVRSKSESLLAELYYGHDLPFRYEQVIWIGSYRFAPDFTFLDAFAREHYWEHSGKTRDLGYLTRRRWKIDLYEESGIVPWRNFIETFDDEDGSLDLEIIDAEITGKLMKRLYLI